MATTNPADKELYPLSTEDGKAIPLDAIRPLSLFIASWTPGASQQFEIPATWKIATFFCERGCYVKFAVVSVVGNTLIAENYEHLNTLFVPPNIIVTSTVLAGTAQILGYDSAKASKLVVQQIQKWSGLALKRQLAKT